MPSLRQLDAEVVTLIGALEHLQQPREALRALADNPPVRYVFLVLPLFGLCVFLEMAFRHVYPRHLVSDHTHLFTPSSIEWMEREFGLIRRSDWWFGSDMLDLLREVSYTLGTSPDTAGMVPVWRDRMGAALDGMQGEIDR